MHVCVDVRAFCIGVCVCESESDRKRFGKYGPVRAFAYVALVAVDQ
jgi:hypothetical protein